MIARFALLTVLAIPAANAADPPGPRRGGMALSVEAGYGGDSLASVSDTEIRAGEGVSVMAGGFYRPTAGSPLEIYGLAGYDFGFVVPVQGGGGYNTNLSTPVLEVLANYRFADKWFVAGGLVSHLNPRLTTDNPA